MNLLGELFDDYDAEYFGVGDYGGGEWGGIVDYAPGFEPGGSSDPYFDSLNYYLGQGYDDYMADQLAQEAAGYQYGFQIETEPGQLPTTPFPDVGDWGYVPYSSFDFYDQWLNPPYINVPDYPTPPAPRLPQSPATQQTNLPPACPTGSYHPYPLGHPSQNVCAPFPESPQQTSKPKPQTGSGSGSSGGSSGGSKPPASQNCAAGQCKRPDNGQCVPIPAGYYRDSQTQVCKPNPQQQACPSGQVRNPSTGQCVTVPACTTPGTVFDARVGRCVPYAQAQQPLCPPGYAPNYSTQKCEVAPTCSPGLVFDQSIGFCVQPTGTGEFDDVLASLKGIPWWVWAAVGGFILLSRKGEDGRTTTVRYRRAS